jgi:hypothetical protein
MHQPFSEDKWYLGWANQNGLTPKTEPKIKQENLKLVYLVSRFWWVGSLTTYLAKHSLVSKYFTYTA